MAQPAAIAQSQTQAEYAAIEAALLETPRGRWFLAEHGRRARRVESAALETAIASLKSSLRAPPAVLGQLRSEVEQLRVLVETARNELFVRGPAAGTPPAALHAADGAGTLGPAGILRAAEDMHQLAWSLHSNAVDVEATSQIARHAAQIYAMSVAHAVESERVRALSARLERAVLHLDGLLETLHHESRDLDDAAPAPPADDADPVGVPLLAAPAHGGDGTHGGEPLHDPLDDTDASRPFPWQTAGNGGRSRGLNLLYSA